eukprot:6198441-Pleurochrysis_carterae.AAC.3
MACVVTTNHSNTQQGCRRLRNGELLTRPRQAGCTARVRAASAIHISQAQREPDYTVSSNIFDVETGCRVCCGTQSRCARRACSERRAHRHVARTVELT